MTILVKSLLNNLHNYKKLVEKVDIHCQRVIQKYKDNIFCRKGCDKCCQYISIFTVEGIAIADALIKLPNKEVEYIKNKAKLSSVNGPCPLLEKNECVLYAARPIICRTHGLPIITSKDEEYIIDYCSLNFSDLDFLPEDAILSLDRLNETFAAINSVFISDSNSIKALPERMTISQALLLH